MELAPVSLDVARERMAAVAPAISHQVQFSTSLDEVPGSLDLVMVVTPAHCRANVVKEITARHQVGAWILEKVLAQSSQQIDLIEKSLERHSQVWVNTPRRLMNWHREIKEQMLASGTVSLMVRMSGGNWGLACNAIHFIDLVSWWTGTTVAEVDCGGLGDWYPSKRSGFHEVFGSLLVKFRGGSSLELNCKQSDAHPRIEVETPEGTWLIDEAAGKAIGPSGQEIAGQMTFQSSHTAPVVEQILDTGRCNLPSFSDSAAQHRPFLDAMLHHWNYCQSREDLSVPIT